MCLKTHAHLNLAELCEPWLHLWLRPAAKQQSHKQIIQEQLLPGMKPFKLEGGTGWTGGNGAVQADRWQWSCSG